MYNYINNENIIEFVIFIKFNKYIIIIIINLLTFNTYQ